MIREAYQSDTEAMVSLLKTCNLYNPLLDYSEWSHPTLVYEIDGKVIGLCQFILAKPYAYFSEIAIHPDYRRFGYGKELMAEMEEIMRLNGIKAWGGFIHEDNPSNLAHHGAALMGRGYAYMKVIEVETDVA